MEFGTAAWMLIPNIVAHIPTSAIVSYASSRPSNDIEMH